MNRSLVIIFITVILDAVGIGLIFPILPALLADVTHAQDVAPHIPFRLDAGWRKPPLCP